MALPTGTLGQLWLRQILPPDVYDGRPLDKKNLSAVLSAVAKQYPERYRDITFQLNQLGRQSAYFTGGNSFGLEHLRKSKVAIANRQKLQQQLDLLIDDDELDSKTRTERIAALVGPMIDKERDEIYNESESEGNPLAEQLKGAGRGNRINLAALRGSDGLYTDHRGRTLPVPVLRSYSEGLSPMEYLASTFGARQGLIQTKFSVADSGFFGKQLVQAAHRLMVEAVDSDKEPVTPRGMPTSVDDPDNEGSLLAVKTGNYPRNTVLTPRIMRELRQQGVQRLLVRSPIAYGAPNGGIYARDAGIREFGRLPNIGERVGITGAQAVAEPLSQGMLCLAEGTRVRMADGSSRAIEDIRPGESVLGCDVAGNCAPTTVLETFDNGVRECVETSFRYCGSHNTVLQLRSTAEHKILAMTQHDGCANARFNNQPRILPVGTRTANFAAVLPRHIAASGSYELPEALLLGVLLGDGCFTESVHGVFLSCADKSLVEDLEDYLRGLNLRLQLCSGQKIYYRLSAVEQLITKRSGAGQFLPGYRNPAAVFLNSYGLMGKYAHEKTIPAELSDLTTESVAQLVAGLWITDGSIYLQRQRSGPDKPYLAFGSTSRKLCRQVRHILKRRFAVYGSVLKVDKRAKRQNYYSFTITAHESVQKFLCQIPLLGVKAARARQWATSFQPRKNASFARCYRRTQRSIGAVPTYDIMVDNADHLFVLANGLVVSNSGKHSAGVAGASTSQSLFDVVNQMIQVPEHIKGGGTHARVDGVVRAVTDAPAGGKYLFIDGERHFAAPGFQSKVKPGDVVEAGDLITDGLPNPAVIVQYKGVGEGRRYFVDAFRKAVQAGKVTTDRKNIELLARGLINHVRLTDEIDDYAPDDVVPYSTLEHSYKPRKGFQSLAPKQAVGKYLERPYLHYTIGTKIRPSMLRDFDDFGVQSVDAHEQPPPFEPEMVRAMSNLRYDPDWMVREFGSYLKEGLLDATHRGGTSDQKSTSFVPGLAQGVNFKSLQPKPPPVAGPPKSITPSLLSKPRNPQSVLS